MFPVAESLCNRYKVVLRLLSLYCVSTEMHVFLEPSNLGLNTEIGGNWGPTNVTWRRTVLLTRGVNLGNSS